MDQHQSQLNPTSRPADPWTTLFLAVLAVSAGLRLLLVRGGGQMLWSDESRYEVARSAVAQLVAHEYGAAARLLLGGADHLFFKVVALLPAALERILATSGETLPALFFASLSVVNILLIWRLARAAGAGPREAALAGGAMALAATNFYYARHLFPYDLAMTFGLLALGLGWTGPARGGRSLGCGLLAGLAFLSYNGAWLLGAVVLVGHVLAGGPGMRRMAGRALAAGAGLALPIAAFIGLGHVVGADLLGSFLQFSRTINQGDFGRGWHMLLEYFWAAEGINLVIMLALLGLVAAGAGAVRRWTRGAMWLAGVAGVGLGLVLLSDLWPKFVIYGRTARFVLPFACLAAGYGLERLWRTGGRGTVLAGGIVLLAVGQGAANFWTPLRQVFPRQFYQEAAALREDLRKAGEPRQLAIIYADALVGRGSILATLPDHAVMLARDNPVQYRPYLFEDYNEADRQLLDGSDVRMRLIAINRARFDHPADLRQPYPGAVRFTLRLPTPRPAPGVPEPLLVTGETGRGDFVYLVYQADGGIRIGFDHWNGASAVSDPIPVDTDQPLVITLSTGPLHGPLAPEVLAAYGVDPHHWLYAEVNGRVIWSHREEFHPCPPESISLLKNYIGGSTAGIAFTGTIVQVQSLLLPPFANRPDEIR